MMKSKRITFLVYIVLAFISSITAFAQAPQALTYQGEARDDNGRIIRNQTLELIFSIYCDDPDHFYTWENTVEITTDEFGMFTAIIGDPGGTDELFNAIPWEYPPIYLTVNMEYRGNWSGDTIQFLSVPYALSAGSVDYNDVLNKPDHFEGNISFENDITVNGLTVGRGHGSNGYNTALGFQALYNNTAEPSGGSENTAIGYYALQLNEEGYSNTAMGSQTLRLNKGSFNTAIGNRALNLNSTGNWNTATGTAALYNNSTGIWNTANGEEALYYNETGNFNTAIGEVALYNNKIGWRNTAVGGHTLHSNVEGYYNTAVGMDAGRATLGSGNVFIGYSAGSYEPGSNTLYIDNQSRGNESNGRTKSLIYGVFDSEPSKQVLTINGNVGIGTPNPDWALDVFVDQGIATISATTYRAEEFCAGQFIGQAARGTQENPLAVQPDDFLASYTGRGYGTTGFSTRPRGRLGICAAEAWTDEHQGAYMTFWTTPVGTIDGREVMRISADGNVGIATDSPGSKLDVMGEINVNNYNITNVANPVNDQDAATKAYVDNTNNYTYSIGDNAQGGIVFWLDASGQHGLVVAPEEFQDILWSPSDLDRYTYATGDGLGAGEMNTAIIIAAVGAENPFYLNLKEDFAAKICADYTAIDDGVTYGDWYLPSKYELNLLYLSNSLPNTGYYWSSTEFEEDANVLFFEDGSWSQPNKKYNYCRVRPIRSF